MRCTLQLLSDDGSVVGSLHRPTRRVVNLFFSSLELYEMAAHGAGGYHERDDDDCLIRIKNKAKKELQERI